MVIFRHGEPVFLWTVVKVNGAESDYGAEVPALDLLPTCLVFPISLSTVSGC